MTVNVRGAEVFDDDDLQLVLCCADLALERRAVLPTAEFVAGVVRGMRLAGASTALRCAFVSEALGLEGKAAKLARARAKSGPSVLSRGESAGARPAPPAPSALQAGRDRVAAEMRRRAAA